MSIRRLLLVLVPVALLAAACGDDGGGGSGSTRDDVSIAALLGELPEPDRSSPPIVVLGDVDRATELAAVERPADLQDTDALRSWAMAITGGPLGDEPSRVAIAPPDALAFESIADWAQLRQDLGYDPLSVGRYAELQNQPQVFSVLDGAADRDDLTAAIGEPDDGMWLLGDEDHGVDLTARGPGRKLGQSLRFGLRDGLLAIGRAQPEVAAWSSGDHTSLADADPAALTVAEALDDAGVYSAMLVLAGAEADADDGGRSGDGHLEPYQAVGVGLGLDGDTVTVTAVYHHDDRDAAAANADALRDLIEDGRLATLQRPFSDFVELDDVRTDGGTVTVSLRLLDGLAGRVWQMLATRDLPASPTALR